MNFIQKYALSIFAAILVSLFFVKDNVIVHTTTQYTAGIAKRLWRSLPLSERYKRCIVFRRRNRGKCICDRYIGHGATFQSFRTR